MYNSDFIRLLVRLFAADDSSSNVNKNSFHWNQMWIKNWPAPYAECTPEKFNLLKWGFAPNNVVDINTCHNYAYDIFLCELNVIVIFAILRVKKIRIFVLMLTKSRELGSKQWMSKPVNCLFSISYGSQTIPLKKWAVDMLTWIQWDVFRCMSSFLPN